MNGIILQHSDQYFYNGYAKLLWNEKIFLKKIQY